MKLEFDEDKVVQVADEITDMLQHHDIKVNMETTLALIFIGAKHLLDLGIPIEVVLNIISDIPNHTSGRSN